MKTKFHKGTPRKQRRRYSRWKSRHFDQWILASILLGAIGKKLP